MVRHANNDSHAQKPPKAKGEVLHVTLEAAAYEELGIMPWFSYHVKLPVKPLPPVADRPHTKTQRLTVRPITGDDLEQFHRLRSFPEVQNHSTTRGRPDASLDETRQNIQRLEAANGAHHWYFGAFLLSTGEMIGEGGLPDCENMPRSGWPEAEILIKPDYWRQGYGTELLNAFLMSWWELPRAPRRHQLLPVVVGDKEPGDKVTEGVGFVWEDTNATARKFFAKALGQAPVSVDGSFTDVDQREGRLGNLVRWNGTLVSNPMDDGSSTMSGLSAQSGRDGVLLGPAFCWAA